MATSNETGSRFDPQSPAFLLDLKNLQVAFSGAAPAVRNVSLTVLPGETVALVGESGSGKSVTSLAVMGLLEADGGKIEAGEILLRTKEGAVVDMRCASEKTRRSVRGRDAAMIFQEPMRSLNPVMTVGEQIAEALRKEIASVCSDLREAGSTENWKEIDQFVPEFNSTFFVKLLKDFPDLSLNERRLCVLLNMNLTTKQIAEITKQSPHSIDIARFRLRNKLGINDRTVSLQAFLSKYNH